MSIPTGRAAAMAWRASFEQNESQEAEVTLYLDVGLPLVFCGSLEHLVNACLNGEPVIVHPIGPNGEPGRDTLAVFPWSSVRLILDR